MSAAYKIHELRGRSGNRTKTGIIAKNSNSIVNGDIGLTGNTKDYLAKNLNREDVADLNYMLGVSIDRNDSVISNEYFDFIEQSKSIIKEFNDGDISNDDLNHKEKFLGHLEDREGALRLTMSLLGNSKHPMAKQKLQEMKLRWARLMISRQMIKNATGNKKGSDNKLDQKGVDEYLYKFDRLPKLRRVPAVLEKMLHDKDNSLSTSLEGKSQKDNDNSQVSKKDIMDMRRKRIARLNSTGSKIAKLRGLSKEAPAPRRDLHAADRVKCQGFTMARFNEGR